MEAAARPKDRCDGSKHGVLGFLGKPDRTRWLVAQSGGYFYFWCAGHSYLGMCGSAKNKCDGAKHNVLGYSGRLSRSFLSGNVW